MLPEETKLTSPLKDVSQARFLGKTYIQEAVVSCAATVTRLLQNNPNRLFWIMINEGVNDVHLSTDPQPTAVTGWLLMARGGVISMYWEQDGEGVGYAVYGIATAINSDVRIREVIRE